MNIDFSTKCCEAMDGRTCLPAGRAEGLKRSIRPFLSACLPAGKVRSGQALERAGVLAFDDRGD